MSRYGVFSILWVWGLWTAVVTTVPVPCWWKLPQEVVTTPHIQPFCARSGHRRLDSRKIHLSSSRRTRVCTEPSTPPAAEVGGAWTRRCKTRRRGEGSTVGSFSLKFLEFNEPFYSEGAPVFISLRKFSMRPLTLISLLPVLAFSPKSSIFRSNLASQSPNLSYYLLVPSSYCLFSSHWMGGYQVCPLRSGSVVCNPTLQSSVRGLILILPFYAFPTDSSPCLASYPTFCPFLKALDFNFKGKFCFCFTLRIKTCSKNEVASCITLFLELPLSLYENILFIFFQLFVNKQDLCKLHIL